MCSDILCIYSVTEDEYSSQKFLKASCVDANR